MKLVLETEPLILVKLEYTDDKHLLEIDSDQKVYLYIENNLVKSIDEIKKVIEILKIQYK